MRRPIRTRRLSIAAIVSGAMFLAITGAGIRSVWVWDQWYFKTWKMIMLSGGRIRYREMSGTQFAGLSDPTIHQSGYSESTNLSGILKFEVDNAEIDPSRPGTWRDFSVWIPLWPILLLLLITPVRWLIARPANASAFPVIADAKPA